MISFSGEVSELRKRNQAMNLQRCFLSLKIIINSSDGGYIHPTEEEEYGVIKKLVAGDFNVLVSSLWMYMAAKKRYH